MLYPTQSNSMFVACRTVAQLYNCINKLLLNALNQIARYGIKINKLVIDRDY